MEMKFKKLMWTHVEYHIMSHMRWPWGSPSRIAYIPCSGTTIAGAASLGHSFPIVHRPLDFSQLSEKHVKACCYIPLRAAFHLPFVMIKRIVPKERVI